MIPLAYLILLAQTITIEAGGSVLSFPLHVQIETSSDPKLKAFVAWSYRTGALRSLLSGLACWGAACNNLERVVCLTAAEQYGIDPAAPCMSLSEALGP